MEFFKNKTNFDFMGFRFVAITFSLLLIGASVFLWVKTGDAKFGVDFRGGNEFVVKFNQPTAINQLREALAKAGHPGAIVQTFQGVANEFSIRLRGEGDKDLAPEIGAVCNTLANGKWEILKQDYVGPVIGDQIRRDAIKAFVVGLVGILIYVTIRFNVVFALGAILALFHDAIIATGATVLMGKELEASTLAAVLTIVGYSVNDTIIIFDRIRENLVLASKSGSVSKKGEAASRAKESLSEIVNLSINETLSRTIVTSLTVFFVCLTLWLFGGGAVSSLAFTLLVGVVVGSYSTIYVASPLVVMLTRK